MIPYIDAHTHQYYGDSSSVLSIRNCIVSKDYFQKEISSVGIHPWYIDVDYGVQMDVLKNYASQDTVLAIGECGLDKMCSTDWNKQNLVFEKQIELAKQLNKPLILHTVRAYQETKALLITHNTTVPVIFHGYNKNTILSKELLEKGYFLSLGADILKKRMDDLICQIPLEQLFLETDDKNNSIKEIYAYFCAVRSIDIVQLKQQLYSNFRTVFNY